MSISPKLILLATSSPCNARCPHCPCTVKPEIRKTEDKYFRKEYFELLAMECFRNNIHIRMSGYGEPLLHPQFDELIKAGRTFNLGMSLITNGSLLHKHTEAILKMASVEISIDSHKKEIYEKIRVGLDYDLVHDNIIKLKSERERMGSKCVIMVSVINQPSRNPDIDGAVKYWEKIVDKVMLRKYVTWGVLPEDDCGSKPDDRRACPYPFERIMIDPSGYFRLCPYDDQKLIPPLGHIEKDSVLKVWSSERMIKIRAQHEKKAFDKIELCSQCTDWAARSWEHNYWKALREASRERR